MLSKHKKVFGWPRLPLCKRNYLHSSPPTVTMNAHKSEYQLATILCKFIFYYLYFTIFLQNYNSFLKIRHYFCTKKISLENSLPAKSKFYAAFYKNVLNIWPPSTYLWLFWRIAYKVWHLVQIWDGNRIVYSFLYKLNIKKPL